MSSHASNSSALPAAEEPQSKEIISSAKRPFSPLRPTFACFSYSGTGRTARLQKASKAFPGGGLQRRCRTGGGVAPGGERAHDSSLPLQHHEQPRGQQASERRQHHADARRERRGLELAGRIPVRAHAGTQRSGGAARLAASGRFTDKGMGRPERIFFFKGIKTKQIQRSALLPGSLPWLPHQQPSCQRLPGSSQPVLWEGGTNPQPHLLRCKQQMGAHVPELGNETVPFHPISHLLTNFPLNKPLSLASTPRTKLTLQNHQKSQTVVISAVSRRGKGGGGDITCSCQEITAQIRAQPGKCCLEHVLPLCPALPSWGWLPLPVPMSAPLPAPALVALGEVGHSAAF